jgi:outer membrane protein assembly factor BamE (lipoprotein component of BamABCDE complex)
MRIATTASIAAAVFAVAGCFTVGTAFHVPATDSLQLGRTTQQELLASVGGGAGVPSNITAHGVPVQCYDFDSYKAGGTAMGRGLLGRSASYCFSGGVLVGYVVTSNLDTESSDFDADKAGTITQGMTRAQVIELLGKPAGMAIHPIADSSNGSQLRYSYTGYAPTPSLRKTILKDAFIELDQNDVVVTSRVTVRQG